MRTAVRRLLVPFLLVLVGMTVTVASPSVADAEVGTHACVTSQGFRPIHPFEIEFAYWNPVETIYCYYSSQHDWLSEIHDATLRGVTQQSKYFSITATDYSNRGLAVRASFCNNYGSQGRDVPHCGARTATVTSGPENPQYHVIEQASPCSYTPRLPTPTRDFRSSETFALRRLMEDTGKIHFNNLGYFQVASPSGNAVSGGSRCPF